MDKDKIKIIILAAGMGKRMKSELPKVLVEFNGKPLIRYLLKSVHRSGVDNQPIIVVGHQREKVMSELGPDYTYAIQEEQLGTGHAVNAAITHISPRTESVVILYGDQPFTSNSTIKKLVERQRETKEKIVMATVKVSDFEDWRANFLGFSRVIRNQNGKIVKTVEKKEATKEEIEIREVNPCYFCFDSAWLWRHLEKLKNDNTQKEYYLTDLIKMATEEGIEIESIEIDAHEALGANSKEELEILEKLVK